MPITVGLYAKWGSGKSFLLKKLQEEMQNFVRDWIDPTFHMSPLLFFVVFHIASFLGLLAWIISNHQDTRNAFLVLLLVTVGTLLLCYAVLFGVWKGTFKSDWYTLYNINVGLAKKFNELKLLVNVVFNHPPGSKWIGQQEKAQPIKLFFTDRSKVSTSAGTENSVIQIIGSLYDSLEATYGTFATRLYRAFRPKPGMHDETENILNQFLRSQFSLSSIKVFHHSFHSEIFCPHHPEKTLLCSLCCSVSFQLYHSLGRNCTNYYENRRYPQHTH